MTPADYPITIYQGDNYDLPLRIRDTNPDGSAAGYKDLTDWTVTSQIRSSASSSTVLATFTATIADQGDLVNGLGLVTLSLTPVQTAALTPTGATTDVYDVQFTDPDDRVYTYVSGSVTVIAEVTR